MLIFVLDLFAVRVLVLICIDSIFPYLVKSLLFFTYSAYLPQMNGNKDRLRQTTVGYKARGREK